MVEQGNDSWGKLLAPGRDVGVKVNDGWTLKGDAPFILWGLSERTWEWVWIQTHQQTKMVKGDHTNKLNFLMREGCVY